MPIKSIRFSQRAREQLARLKRHTGIEHMNVLARWGLCVSLAESMPPPAIKLMADSNLEMSWDVFAGRYADVLIALVRQRCLEDGLATDDGAVIVQLRLHIHRGISYLAGDRKLRRIGDLMMRVERTI